MSVCLLRRVTHTSRRQPTAVLPKARSELAWAPCIASLSRLRSLKENVRTHTVYKLAAALHLLQTLLVAWCATHPSSPPAPACKYAIRTER